MQLQDALDVQIYDALTREHRADKAARYMITYFGYDGDPQLLAERIDDLVTIIRSDNRRRGLILLVAGSVAIVVGLLLLALLWHLMPYYLDGGRYDPRNLPAGLILLGLAASVTGVAKALVPADYDTSWGLW